MTNLLGPRPLLADLVSKLGLNELLCRPSSSHLLHHLALLGAVLPLNLMMMMMMMMMMVLPLHLAAVVHLLVLVVVVVNLSVLSLSPTTTLPFCLVSQLKEKM